MGTKACSPFPPWPAFSRLSFCPCIHNILRRKGTANRECAKYRHPHVSLFRDIPLTTFRSFPIEKLGIPEECQEIPCLHSLHVPLVPSDVKS